MPGEREGEARRIGWLDLRDMDRPDCSLAMAAYLDAPEPVPTGIGKLDQLLGGGLMRGMTVIGGPPSSGKSVVACLMASNLAAAGRKVVYASYEMSWEVVQLRCASAWSCRQGLREGLRNFGWSAVANGSERRMRPQYAGLGREELSRYEVGSAADPITRTLTAWEEGPGRNLAVLTGGYDVRDLCAAVGALDCGEPPALVVDYVQIVPSGERGDESEYARVTEVVNALQRLAYSGRVACVVAISSTRNLRQADLDEGPDLGWYRGSGYVGFAAEQAVMLVPRRTRDEASGQMVPSLTPDGWMEGRMTVVKNKSGASGVSVPTEMAGWCCLLR